MGRHTLISRTFNICHEKRGLVHHAQQLFLRMRPDGGNRRRQLGCVGIILEFLQLLLVDWEGRLVGGGERIEAGLWQVLDDLGRRLVEVEELIEVIWELLDSRHGA